MKLVFITDLHIGRPPARRTDDYHASLLDKLTRVINFANKKEVNFLILGGDLFDVPRVQPAVIHDISEIFAECHSSILYVCGEHDVVGHSRDTVRNCSISLLDRMCPNLHMLDPFYSLQGVVRWDIKGIHCWDKSQTGDLVIGASNKIMVVHSLITPKSMPFETYPIPELTSASPLVLSGDFHYQFHIHSGNTQWVNPGPLARRKPTDKLPHAAYIEIDDKGKVDVKLIPIRCQEANWIEQSSDKPEDDDEVDVSEFTKKLREFEKQSGNIYELFDRIAEQQDVPKEVRDLVKYLKDEQ